MGKPVVMGRKTYLSTHDKPLPGRTNIVVTRDANFTAPGVLVAPSLEAALEAARGDALRRGTDIMVIGGADIYAQAMPLADRLEITQVHMAPEGDTLFPAIDPAVWREAASGSSPGGSGRRCRIRFRELSQGKRARPCTLTEPPRRQAAARQRVERGRGVPYNPRRGTRPGVSIRRAGEDLRCHGAIKAAAPGAAVAAGPRGRGARDRNRPVRRRPTSKICCAAARTS